VTTAGAYKFFAGIRSDPFFFDLMGFLAGFKFTGSDFFADKNIFGMALEVPNRAVLGSNPKVGIWARVLLPTNGSVRDEHDDDDEEDDRDDRHDHEDQLSRARTAPLKRSIPTRRRVSRSFEASN
jgi:hypothetical protein